MAVVDVIKDQDELNSFEYKPCFLWPRRWNTVADLNFLAWTMIDFNAGNNNLVPANPGIYSFLISPINANIPHLYLGYIGKTNRTLRERYGEYLHEMNNEKGRPKLVRMLNKWNGYVKFAFTVNFNGHSIDSVESRLNDAYLPPFNDKYSLSINRIINAF